MKQEVTKAADKSTIKYMEQSQAKSWWSKLSPKQQALITNIAVWSGISLLAAVTLFFGVRFVKKHVANHEKGKSFGDDKWATWADQIKNAISNDGVYFGTDEVALRKVLVAIPSKQDYEKVERSYKKQFNDNMTEAIRGDLSTSEYDEMLAIINSKPLKAKDAGAPIYDPHGWAKRLNAAFNYETWGFLWGTDKEAIRAVIKEMPTRQAYLDTAEAYEEEFGVKLMDDIKGDLSPYEIVEFAKMLEKKPYQ